MAFEAQFAVEHEPCMTTPLAYNNLCIRSSRHRHFYGASANAAYQTGNVRPWWIFSPPIRTPETEMPGTGGARKVRFARPGEGKRGGYRIITFFSGADVPVFLLSVFAKNEKSDLSKDEKSELKKLLQVLPETYRRR